MDITTFIIVGLYFIWCCGASRPPLLPDGTPHQTSTNELQDEVAEGAPKRSCERGMHSTRPSASGSLPYPLVKLNGLDFSVLCDTATDGGGWIIIQRRSSSAGSHFFKNWEKYKQGFGSFTNNFWLGNDKIHALTNGADYELRVELGYNGTYYYANYDAFSVADEESKYRLMLGNYTAGTAGDSFQENDNMAFTTSDRDNDRFYGPLNCAVVNVGAWWYNACGEANLNGWWGVPHGVVWPTLTGTDCLSFTEMKIRRKN